MRNKGGQKGLPVIVKRLVIIMGMTVKNHTMLLNVNNLSL